MGNDESSNISGVSGTSAAVPLEVIPLHSTNLLTVLDADGVIQYESPSIERIFGFDQEELVTEHVADYFHPDDREKVIDVFDRIVDSEEFTVESVEYRHATADGAYLWVESVASANPTPNGDYVINTRDISDRKAREEELQQTNDQLEAFASVVSHDLRNPLNVALGRLELAKQESESDQLDSAVDAVNRSLSLIDDLLKLAREGRQVKDLETVDLAGVVEDCWKTVETADATLDVRSVQAIRADQGRLKQLFENLFRNAVEHGGEEVTVWVGDLDDGFYLEDDGHGIPEDERETVLDVGYSTSERGTGFGLGIVRQIADAHGWEMAVAESESGGARFEFNEVDIGS